jgi:hypothetical protein
MRTCVVSLAAILVLTSCGSQPKPEPAAKAETPKPPDESARFATANLVETKVVDKELMGKPFMPGGTLARYKKGKKAYEMFVTKLPTATDAAILLPDWRKALTDSKLVPSFGGYFGIDAGRPVFVFSKGAWIAGISGLSEKEADAEARILAARLN